MEWERAIVCKWDIVKNKSWDGRGVVIYEEEKRWVMRKVCEFTRCAETKLKDEWEISGYNRV